MNKENIGLSILLVSMITVFVLLYLSSSKYKDYKTEFKTKCNNNGGIVLEQGDYNHHPVLHCMNPNSIIQIK